MAFKNSNENVIYEAVTDTNDSSYLVALDQIYDIVGEENWIHGESNCLVNLASGQTITLSWGAKKKERKEQRRVLSDEGLQVGDHVFVENLQFMMEILSFQEWSLLCHRHTYGSFVTYWIRKF
jgi:hypothetical protein